MEEGGREGNGERERRQTQFRHGGSRLTEERQTEGHTRTDLKYSSDSGAEKRGKEERKRVFLLLR